MIPSTTGNGFAYDISAVPTPTSVEEAFELIAAARILLCTAADVLARLAPEIAAADETSDLSNTLGDIIDDGRLAVLFRERT